MNPSVVAVNPVASSAIVRCCSPLISAHAQCYASIDDAVADLSDTVISSVVVTLTSYLKNQALESTTSWSDLYRLNTFPLNNFSITVEAGRFNRKTLDKISIFSQQPAPRFAQMDGMRSELQPANNDAKFPEAEL